MKGKNIILFVLLLAIGFATVSSTLILNGILKQGRNNMSDDEIIIEKNF